MSDNTRMRMRSIFFRPLWKWFNLLLIAYGILDFIRDDFLPIDMANKLRIGGLIGSIDWYWWVILGLVIFIIATLFTKANDNVVTERKGFEDERIRLANGMPPDFQWREHGEHPLTVINDCGQNLTNCFVMLDEVARRDYEKDVHKWRVLAKEVFDRPFRWKNKPNSDGKIDIGDGERASFVFISHHEYSVLNVTTNSNDAMTEFYFEFFGDVREDAFLASDIRVKISIRGKNETGADIKPIRYLIYVHLLQAHGIPKVEIIRTERIKY